MKTLAIDAMGGDFGPPVCVPACAEYLQSVQDARVVLVGDSRQIKPLIPHHLIRSIDVIHCEHAVAMGDKPSQVVRSKEKTSMSIAVELVQQKDADACVSAGNTGALMALSKRLLTMIEGVSRPAIMGVVPSVDGYSYLLDMGANVDCDAEQLLEFALMATLLVQALDEKISPSVALLNNGQEDIKGNSQVKQAAELLTNNPFINYIGFIEGHNLYQAVADIIVCDGFVGNIALKASEGVANFILDVFRREVDKKKYLKPLFWLLLQCTRRASKQVDPRYLNGACFLGVKGVVVKSHGHADSFAFKQALLYAHKMVDANIVDKLSALSEIK